MCGIAVSYRDPNCFMLELDAWECNRVCVCVSVRQRVYERSSLFIYKWLSFMCLKFLFIIQVMMFSIYLSHAPATVLPQSCRVVYYLVLLCAQISYPLLALCKLFTHCSHMKCVFGKSVFAKIILPSICVDPCSGGNFALTQCVCGHFS